MSTLKVSLSGTAAHSYDNRTEAVVFSGDPLVLELHCQAPWNAGELVTCNMMSDGFVVGVYSGTGNIQIPAEDLTSGQYELFFNQNGSSASGYTATITKVLGSLSDDDMALTLDRNKRIMNTELHMLGVQGDMESEVLDFRFPRYADGIDLSEKIISIHYITFGGNASVDTATNVHTDDEYVYFSWVISSEVTAHVGEVNFAVHCTEVNPEGLLIYSWATQPAKLPVKETVTSIEQIREKNPDAINQWLEIMAKASEAQEGYVLGIGPNGVLQWVEQAGGTGGGGSAEAEIKPVFVYGDINEKTGEGTVGTARQRTDFIDCLNKTLTMAVPKESTYFAPGATYVMFAFYAYDRSGKYVSGVDKNGKVLSTPASFGGWIHFDFGASITLESGYNYKVVHNNSYPNPLGTNENAYNWVNSGELKFITKEVPISTAEQLPAVVPEGLPAETEPNTQAILNALAKKIGEGGGPAPEPEPVVKHTVTYDLRNVKSSNSETSVENGKSYTTKLTADPSYTLDSPVITMGGTNVTSSVWSSETSTIFISSVTGNVTITCAGVESQTFDTSPKIAQYGGALTDDGRIITGRADGHDYSNGCVTEFYPVLPERPGKDKIVIFFAANLDEIYWGGNGKVQEWTDEKQNEYWSITAHANKEFSFQIKVGTTRFRTTLFAPMVEDSYAYYKNDGTIIFAGKNTKYYGMTNIDGTNPEKKISVAKAIDRAYSMNALSAGVQNLPDIAGLSPEYIQMCKDNYDAMMTEALGDYNKIPFVLHTDQHGRIGAKNPVMELIGKLTNWYEISKCINLGDTCTGVFSKPELDNYLSATKNWIPMSKRLDVYGNHDVWDGLESQKYTVNQKRLSPYFKNIYSKRYGNNGYFTSLDPWFNVKYLVSSDYEYPADNFQRRRVTTTQAAFLVEELGKEDGYDIIIATHQPLDATGSEMVTRDPDFISYNETYISDPTVNKSFLDMIAARKNKTSGTFVDSEGVSHPYDFTKCKTKLLLSVHGHAHFEAYQRLDNSIMQFIFDWFDKNTFYWGYIDRKAMKLVVWKNAPDAGNGRLEVQLT